MLPFDCVFADLAQRESRYFRVLDESGLPSGTYVFREFFCNDPGCDCRRVVLQIHAMERGRLAATINYAFEPSEPPYEDEDQIFLDPLSPQSEHADVLFDMFEEMIASDDEYRARLIRHYELWKRVVDDPTHPDHPTVRSADHDDPSFTPAFRRREPSRRDGPKVGPNETCPCGSGRKYKRCCRP